MLMTIQLIDCNTTFAELFIKIFSVCDVVVFYVNRVNILSGSIISLWVSFW